MKWFKRKSKCEKFSLGLRKLMKKNGVDKLEFYEEGAKIVLDGKDIHFVNISFELDNLYDFFKHTVHEDH